MKIHPEILHKYNDNVWVKEKPFEIDNQAISYTQTYKNRHNCGSCNSTNTILLHVEGYGDISGGYRYVDYQCKDCNLFTRYCFEYG